MEVKCGDIVPMSWMSETENVPEVVGFNYNTKTGEDIIICRCFDKGIDRYVWAAGTCPRVAVDGSKIYWLEGNYTASLKGAISIPEGFEPDHRESISVPGQLVRQRHLKDDLKDCRKQFGEEFRAFRDKLQALGMNSADINAAAVEVIRETNSHQYESSVDR